MSHELLFSHCNCCGIRRSHSFHRLWRAIGLICVAVAGGTSSCWAIDSATVPNSANDQSIEIPDNPFGLDKQLSCGPRCVQFVLDLYRQEVPFATILQECTPGPRGTSLKQVQDSLQLHQVYTSPFSDASINSLKLLHHPAIVHVNTRNNAGHFLVLINWNDATNTFLTFNPPDFYGSLEENEIARNLSGAGLVVSDSPLPPAEKLVDPSPSIVPSLAITILSLLWLSMNVSSWRVHRVSVRKQSRA